MKTGLVLEGGAMRGLFTAGVIDVLLENGIGFDACVGVSAGAVFGCNFKSRQAGRVLRYNKRYCRDPRYCGLRSLIRTGDFYGADFCYRELPESLDPFDVAAYRANPMPFYVVCTDIESGEAVLHRCELGDGADMDWFRASASMPMVSRPVEIDGRKYLDGGIADSIPLRRFEEMGYERNLVVLTQPADYRKQKNRALPVMRLSLRRYPAALELLEHRHEVYNASLAYVRQQEAAGRILVIRPAAPLPVSRTDRNPDHLQACYALGRAAAQGQIEDIKAFVDGQAAL